MRWFHTTTKTNQQDSFAIDRQAKMYLQANRYTIQIQKHGTTIVAHESIEVKRFVRSMIYRIMREEKCDSENSLENYTSSGFLFYRI